MRSICHLKKSYRSPPQDFILADHEAEAADPVQSNRADLAKPQVQFSNKILLAPLLTKKSRGKAGWKAEKPADQAALTHFSLPTELYEDTKKKKFRWRHLDTSSWEKYMVLPAPKPSTPSSSVLPTLSTLRSCLRKHSNPQ